MLTVSEIRPARLMDTPQMAAVLNEIIDIGGTTAFEDPVSADQIASWYLETGLFTHVAVDSAGDICGFQAVETDPGGDETIGYISSFARQTPLVRGTGSALFAATLKAARARGLVAIDAKIRGDNVPGLAYYEKMGFRDHHVVPDVPLKDGTPVDRIVKRLSLD